MKNPCVIPSDSSKIEARITGPRRRRAEGYLKRARSLTRKEIKFQLENPLDSYVR